MFRLLSAYSSYNHDCDQLSVLKCLISIAFQLGNMSRCCKPFRAVALSTAGFTCFAKINKAIHYNRLKYYAFILSLVLALK
jgi:hypothetical protein